MEFLEKLQQNPWKDLWWNVPEQKLGTVTVVGGNAGGFRAVVKTAEYLAREYPVREVRIAVPDALRGKLPEMEGVIWLASTDSGSMADGDEVARALDSSDWGLVVGDLSKNAITAREMLSAVKEAERPVLVTRDAVDLIAAPGVDMALLNERLVVFASMAQLSKLLQAAYYPKVLMMSQPLVQVVEALHKFTLSYPVGVVTLHDGQILVAKDGRVVGFSLELAGVSPLMLWGGEVAARIVALNLYNPGKFVEATVTGILGEKAARD